MVKNLICKEIRYAGGTMGIFSVPMNVQIFASRLAWTAKLLGSHRVATLASQLATYDPKNRVKVPTSVFDITMATATLKWTSDPWDGNLDVIKHPTFMQQAINSHPDYSGDCLPSGTLLLTEDYTFVPIESLTPATKIWGLDNWTTVKNVWSKGDLPVDVVFLNNGSSFKATKDHKIYVALCTKHPVVFPSGKSCACPVSDRVVERITIEKAIPGMVLLTPDKISTGTSVQDPDVSYVDGLFLSDGWCSHDNDFDIAGLDGHPKEAQKREVQDICSRLGIETVWFNKSIRVKDKNWATKLHKMGSHAPEKHALSINIDETSAKQLLRGIMADSGANTCGSGRTFTTTSRELMLQTRVLHKMFGVSCGESYIVDHGGLGKHPIWRLNARGTDKKLLRIKHIDRDVDTLPVYDIATEDHYVYLPEADVTVSNCDDYANYWVAALTLGKLADEVFFGSTMWLDGNKIQGHACCVYRVAKQWWWVSNWHGCVPQKIEKSDGWVDGMLATMKKPLVVAGKYSVERVGVWNGAEDTVVYGQASKVR